MMQIIGRYFQPISHFYLDRARSLGGNTLELACGTGRITIPLAEEGINIWGLDYSSSMLEVLKAKVSKLSKESQQKIHTIFGDMTDFILPEQFKLIFIPFRSFQSLENDEQALRCLSCVDRHLEDEGQFIINVFKPLKEIGEWWINLNEKLDFESTLEGGEKVTRHSINKAYDLDKRLLFTEYIYRLYKGNELIEEYHDSIRLRYFYGDDIRELIASSGFTIEKEYGWYDGTPINEGNEFIFVCRKA
ncbi:class I SAM-dependent methyltransferase [Rubeoparvulum massiliense]|uniref:class I SAM-dependent methyltransferase n=1 Tax=Rubeoparvulum massiliense TaxID=1631346 RepID=UPI00065E1FA6|nr:class I SAM-dependent methyltransferase [Rubeoparvulum massiliense]